MRNALDLLTQYAAYHRDRRNIVTHFVGIPMIVFGIAVFLTRPTLALFGVSVTLAWLLWAVASLWYLSRGNLALGGATSAATFLLFAVAHRAGDASIGIWLAWSLGFFVVGWIVQFVGHYYEGRKPAFVDDLTGLLVGPMFVVAEWMFMLGWNRPMLEAIEAKVGPTVVRDLAHPA